MYFSAMYRIDYVDIAGPSAARGRQTRQGWETSHFRAKCVNIWKTVRGTSSVRPTD